jgi:HlyD family secretion protein
MCIAVAVSIITLTEPVNSQINSSNYYLFNVIKEDIEISTSGTGNIEASEIKEVKSLNNGIVDKVFVKEGEQVQEGELILTFKNDEENLKINQLKLDLNREENRLEILKNKLKNLKVYANESGFIGNISVDIGDQLMQGQTITTITDKINCEISGLFNKKQIENIKVGDKAQVIFPDTFYTVEGTVVRVKESPIPKDSGAVLYEAIVKVENPGGFTEDTKGIVTVNNDNGEFRSLEETYIQMKPPKEVKSNIDGTLSKIHVSSGAYVEKGELIAELENTDLLKEIENQQIIIDKKRLEINNRIKSLEENTVYAPIDGTVTQVNIVEGEGVNSFEILMVISNLDNLKVTIPVKESYINKIKVGQEAIVTGNALDNVKVKGEVSEIGLVGNVNDDKVTFDVTIRLDRIDKIKPGMTVDAEILIDKKINTLIIPIEAVQKEGSKSFVFVKKGNIKEKVFVKTGIISQGYIEIKEGLNENDTVIYPD